MFSKYKPRFCIQTGDEKSHLQGGHVHYTVRVFSQGLDLEGHYAIRRVYRS